MSSDTIWPSLPIGEATACVSPAELNTELPIIRGSAGLVGRPQMFIRPEPVQPVGEDEDGNPLYAQEPAAGKSLPGSCLRVLTSPRAECSGDCAGLMRDGSCLADVARDNPGLEFAIDPEGFWTLKS